MLLKPSAKSDRPGGLPGSRDGQALAPGGRPWGAARLVGQKTKSLMIMRILYQFPISHYCEKSRWQLEHKGLAYETRDLLPGAHWPRTRWLARIGTVPVLRDGERRVGDSTKIAYYLEKYYPERSLIPEDAALRHRVIELEQQFDRLGVHLRTWMYGHVLDRPETMELLLAPAGMAPWITRLLAPPLREAIRRKYAINPKSVVYAGERVEDGLTLVETLLVQNGGDYLVGDRLTLADITAASLLAPMMGIAGTPWEGIEVSSLPEPVRHQFRLVRERSAGQWVKERYLRDR
tara:strand:+ start:502 stop:1374 length:873 start_codon:yes stop_codon:yes gene_type:complete